MLQKTAKHLLGDRYLFTVQTAQVYVLSCSVNIVDITFNNTIAILEFCSRIIIFQHIREMIRIKRSMCDMIIKTL